MPHFGQTVNQAATVLIGAGDDQRLSLPTLNALIAVDGPVTMSLKQTISDHMKDAMRAKDSVRLDNIRLLRAAIQRVEVDDRVELDDAGVVTVIQKMVKQSQDAVKQFVDGGRDDLVAKEQSCIDVLSAYLPAQLDSAAINAKVTSAIAESGASSMKDMGKVMASLKAELAGQADMSAVSKMVKDKLSA